MTKLLSMYERDDRPELAYPGGDKQENLSCDIAVIGGGGSGLSAAVRAAQLGKKVVVIEKMDKLGGNSWLAGGLLSTTSKYQRALGQQDQTDAFLQKNYSLHKYTLDPAIFSRYIRNSGPYFEWLVDLGLDMDNIRYVMDSVVMIKNRLEPGPLNNPSYGPGLLGSALINVLSAQLDKLGIVCRMSTKVTKLLTDESGAVCGFEAIGQEGTLTVNAKAVIMASGGFGGNTEMLRRFLPKYFSTDNYMGHYCWLSSTGDGLTMAEEIGAEVGKGVSIAIEGLAHVPGAYSIQRAFRDPTPPIVNRKGQRFIAEDDTYDAEYAVDLQPDGLGFQIMDSDLLLGTHEFALANARFGDPIASLEEYMDDLQREVGEGKTFIADTIEELAPFVGCAPEVLKASIDKYNADCAAGFDSQLYKDAKYLKPVVKAPFYAVRLHRKFDVTMGGVTIDPMLRALRPDKSVVKGLYAAGDVASNWMGVEYGPMFSSFAWAMNSGYLAAEEAAAYIV